MGEWMMLPQADAVIAKRTKRFIERRDYYWRGTQLGNLSGFASNIDFTDIANLADVEGVPLWECERDSSVR